MIKVKLEQLTLPSPTREDFRVILIAVSQIGHLCVCVFDIFFKSYLDSGSPGLIWILGYVVVLASLQQQTLVALTTPTLLLPAE